MEQQATPAHLPAHRSSFFEFFDSFWSSCRCGGSWLENFRANQTYILHAVVQVLSSEGWPTNQSISAWMAAVPACTLVTVPSTVTRRAWLPGSTALGMWMRQPVSC